MSKKRKLTEEEKAAMRKDRNKSIITSTLITGVTTASTFFGDTLNKREMEENRRKYYETRALFENLPEDVLANYCQAFGIICDTTDTNQDDNTKTL